VKKKIVLTMAAVMAGTLLMGCGSDTDENIEKLKQTGKLTDYSSYVQLGNYKGYEVTVDSVEVTDEEVKQLIDDILFNYYSMYPVGDDFTYTWDDTTACAISDGKFTSTEAYEAYRREGMQAERQREQEQKYLDTLWEMILEGSTFTGIDEAEISNSAERYYAQQKRDYEYYASYYGYSYDEYLLEKQGLTDEQLHDQCYEYVLIEKERVIASSSIFYAEGMQLTDAEFSKGVSDLLKTYTGYQSSAEFVETFGEDYVREYLVSKKVDEFLKNANIMIIQ